MNSEQLQHEVILEGVKRTFSRNYTDLREDHDCNGERCAVCRRKADDANDILRIFGSKRSLTIEELAVAVHNSMEEEEIKVLKEVL